MLSVIRYLFLFLFFTKFAQADAVQTHILNGVWTPIGINSVYQDLSSVAPWNSGTDLVITDVADDKFTHIASTSSSYGYALPTGTSSTMDELNNTTIFNNATISIFAIKNAKTVNGRSLDGTSNNAFHIKILNPKSKKDVPMQTMYIEGLSAPVARIVYQADYEGDRLKIKFGENTSESTKTFFTYFSSANTYDNPAKLYVDSTVPASVKRSALIKDSIDFNITDNNLTNMSFDVYDIENDLKAYSTRDELIVYKFDKGNWSTFNSKNIKDKSNNFDSFSVGEAYWVKAESQDAHDDNNFTKIGLISSSIGSIDQSVYENMSYGWNMTTFSNDYRFRSGNSLGPKYSLTLRYSPTSMFIPSDILELQGINLFFKPFSSDVSIFDQNITLQISTTGKYRNTSDVAQGINIATFARNKFYDEDIKLRAFPAMNRAGNEGLIVISNRSFEVNSSNASITTLSGGGLIRSASNRSFSPYGDYILASKLVQPSSAVNLSMSMQVNFHLLSSTPATINDLNTTSNLDKISKVYDGFSEASKDTSGVSRINSDVYLIDLDFNSSQDYNNENLFSSMIMGSSEKMNIKDSTLLKIFRYNVSGNFYILGTKNKQVFLPLENNMTKLVDAINVHTVDTGVTASELNTTSGNYFIIFSQVANDLSSFDLREDKINLFDYFISLSSSLLPDQDIVKGALGTVYTHDNLLSSTLNIDEDVLYGLNTQIADYSNKDLLDINEANFEDGNGSINTITFFKSSTNLAKVYAPSFPQGSFYSFPLIFTHTNKRVESMISQEISANGTPYWEAIDLTKSPQDWLGTRDYKKGAGNDFDIQSLLHIKENKAYWVYVSNASRSRSVSRYNRSNKVSVKKSFVNYFDNNITDNGEIQIENHIFHKILVKFDNTEVSNFVAREYGISTQIGYQDVYDFNLVDGDEFELILSDTYMPIEDGIHVISLKSDDEIGSNFLGKPTKVTIDFKKPLTPRLTWVNNELIADNLFKNETIEVYHEYISENVDIREKNFLQYPALHKNDILKWTYGEDKNNYGAIKKLAIAVNKQGLYSDAKVILYAPLNSGHVLSLDYNTNSHSTNKPYSFELSSATYSSGVQLARLDKAKLDKESVKLLYHPKKNNLSSSIQFGVPHVLYLYLKNSEEPIVSISYSQEYSNSIFYFEYKRQIYQGRFPVDSGERLSLDVNNTIDIFNFDTINDTLTDKDLRRLDYSPSVSNAQSIVIK